MSSIIRKVESIFRTGGPTTKGTWRDNLRTFPLTAKYSPDELVKRPLAANFIARPVVSALQTYETVVDVIIAPVKEKPARLFTNVKKGITERIDFNKTFIQEAFKSIKEVF